jgi:hypothetical protein
MVLCLVNLCLSSLNVIFSCFFCEKVDRGVRSAGCGVRSQHFLSVPCSLFSVPCSLFPYRMLSYSYFGKYLSVELKNSPNSTLINSALIPECTGLSCQSEGTAFSYHLIGLDDIIFCPIMELINTDPTFITCINFTGIFLDSFERI